MHGARAAAGAHAAAGQPAARARGSYRASVHNHLRYTYVHAGIAGTRLLAGAVWRFVMLLVVAATFAACTAVAAAREDGAATAPLPQPVAFWTFQEPTGVPRVSTSRARHSYVLTDGDAAHPVESTNSEGLFGPRAVNFTASSPTQRLRAVRSTVPALTTDLAGPDAVVSIIAWVKRPSGRYFHGFLAGVWSATEAPTECLQPNIGLSRILCLTVAAGVMLTGTRALRGRTRGSMPCISIWVRATARLDTAVFDMLVAWQHMFLIVVGRHQGTHTV